MGKSILKKDKKRLKNEIEKFAFFFGKHFDIQTFNSLMKKD